MGKRASDSGTAATTSTSLAIDIPPTTPNRLRIKPVQNSTSKVRDDELIEKEARNKSAKRSKTSLKKKIDPNKPKKPPTAFFYFLEDFRRGYQEENPKVKTMRDIGKACGEKWKIMTYEEKVKYYDIATEKRAEFDRAMAEYIRRKESGEDAQSEDSDLDFDY
ncbi:high mobility group B protein 14 isoform X2 [Beta vulgaris subsp. vulgaris]|uniref:high mobility group B protein 14 isoform X2 n=1 Tax=Beta vulgaris subsp. vulgaris TaxID=3555 RepID=UPI002036AA2B|nr:high mobility group B protein 14 isoform X2 [Beta vulgaris subsp. vulgaris]